MGTIRILKISITDLAADVEEMLLSGSGTWPAAGFFEMKQEVYEIAMR